MELGICTNRSRDVNANVGYNYVPCANAEFKISKLKTIKIIEPTQNEPEGTL